jgi:hypothetical protein
MVKGVQDGLGKSVRRDGRSYEGEFCDGKWHGSSVMTSPVGTRIERQSQALRDPEAALVCLRNLV